MQGGKVTHVARHGFIKEIFLIDHEDVRERSHTILMSLEDEM
jgi:hypothetical protein